MDEQTIFITALQQPSPAERDAYVDQVCADDAAMRRRINALIAAHHRDDGLLEAPLVLEPGPDDDLQPGRVIGNYRLLDEVGEGGFGVVYLAEQRHPVQRRVALKIIKLGMDTRQVVERFEAERQTLALMEHPSIAKVYDAGTTDSGRPYFVMEYVSGIPITQFCREQRLDVHQRMQLFAVVCRAIHHAHQKAVIHRDIKPSNVLVTLENGQPIAKIIDFGIAKALQEPNTPDMPRTGEHQRLGTPAYMSPEQAAGEHTQVDTRSDVYSLGVLAYEMLVGQPPFAVAGTTSRNDWTQRPNADELVAPSQQVQRLTRSGKWCNQGLDDKQLRTQLRRDLDWILLTALATDRNDRYQSALSLAADIERFLRNDPIEARPPSALYRTRKFLRRRRAALLMAFIPAVLVGTLIATHWMTRQQYVREHQRRVEANRQRIEVAMHEAHRWYDPLRRKGHRDVDDIRQSVEAARRAEALLDPAEADPMLVSRVRGLVARLEREHADVLFLEQMRDSRLDFPGASSATAQNGLDHFRKAFQALGIEPLAIDVDSAVSLLSERPPEVRQMAVAALDLWAVSLQEDQRPLQAWLRATARRADPDPWRGKLRDAIAGADVDALVELAHTPELNRQPPPALMLLATALQQHRHPAALLVLRRAADAHPDVFVFNALVGSLYSRQGASLDADALRRAIRHLSSALAVRPDDLRVLNMLATNLSRTGEHEDAVSLLKRAVVHHPDHWQSWHNLSLALARQGEFHQAVDASQQTLVRLYQSGAMNQVGAVLQPTLDRIALSLQVVHSVPIESEVRWQYATNPPADWHPSSPADASFSSGAGPFGSSLFSPAVPWHTDRIVLRCSFESPARPGLTTGNPTTLLAVVSSVAQGELFLNGSRVATFVDSGGDPRGYVCGTLSDQQSESNGLAEEGAEPVSHNISVSLIAHRTRVESLVDVHLYWLDSDRANEHVTSALASLSSQLADLEKDEPVVSEALQRSRSKMRTAIDAAARELLATDR